MKRFLLFVFTISICSIAFAHTINWHDDNTTTQTTCNNGDNITPPTPIGKYGYHFIRWEGYTQIEYLESTGVQYIDTGFAFNTELRQYPFVVDFTVAITQKLSSERIQTYFAGADSGIMGLAQYRWDSDDQIAMKVNGAGYTKGFIAENVGQPVHLRYSFDDSSHIYSISGNLTVEPERLPNNGGRLSVSSTNICLFKACSISSVAPVRIYHFAFESNGVKIRDFIPVIDQDGIPCLYDKVENKFYYNAGTGQFIAGPVIQQ